MAHAPTTDELDQVHSAPPDVADVTPTIPGVILALTCIAVAVALIWARYL